MKYFAPITDYVVKSTGDYVVRTTGDYVVRTTGDYIRQTTYIKTSFFPVIHSDSFYSSKGVVINAAGDSGHIYFHIPNEVNTISEAKVVIVSNIANNLTLSYRWYFSDEDDAWNTYTGSVDNVAIGNVVVDDRLYIDLPNGFKSNLSPNRSGNLVVVYEAPGETFDGYILGFLIKYSVRESG